MRSKRLERIFFMSTFASSTNGNEIFDFMKTTERLLSQLMRMEGLRLTAYRDAAGVPTIGYGHTRDVRMGDRITEDWARQLLRQDVAEVERQVKAMQVARSEGQLDALVSFAYNVGIGRLRQSTLLRRIREGGTKLQIQREFKRWVFAGGRRLRGLELRREWEANRFFESEPLTDAEIIERV